MCFKLHHIFIEYSPWIKKVSVNMKKIHVVPILVILALVASFSAPQVFAVLPPSPSPSPPSPATGPPGTSVTTAGSGFDPTKKTVYIFFNGALVDTASLVGTVPSG